MGDVQVLFDERRQPVKINHVGRRRLQHAVAHRHRHDGNERRDEEHRGKHPRDPSRPYEFTGREKQRDRHDKRQEDLGDDVRAAQGQKADERRQDRLRVNQRVVRQIRIPRAVERAFDSRSQREQHDEDDAHRIA